MCTFVGVMKNPFVLRGYAGREYFCDRQEETQRLIGFVTNGNNVVLTAPRRMGKTDLISHVFAQPEIADHYITIALDIYATQSYADFVVCFGQAIVNALRPRGKAIVDQFVALLHSLRSEISFDINGMPVWGIGIGQGSNPETTLDEIFHYLEAADKPCIVAIDEFQQITKYGTDAWRVEATLRSYIQRCHNATFIYAGSQQHLMAEMFTSQARPFYASSTIMSLAPLKRDVYAQFCRNLFERHGLQLAEGVAEAVYDRMDGVTAYMHRVMNQLFAMTRSNEPCCVASIDAAIATIVDSAADSYNTLYYQMTEKQRSILLAVAAEGVAENVSSGAFVRKYRLHSASSALSAIKTLLDKDLVARTGNAYSVSDKFFGLWLATR